SRGNLGERRALGNRDSGGDDILVEPAGGDGNGPFVGQGEVLGIGDEQGQVGQAVETAGQAAAGVVEGGQGVGGEQGRVGAGSRQPGQDVRRRLGFGQGTSETTRREPVGQARGKIEQDLGAPDQ